MINDEIKEFNPEKYVEMLENNELYDYIINLQESEAYYYGQYKDYKSRCEKADEYIKINFVEDIITVKTLLNILNDKE